MSRFVLCLWTALTVTVAMGCGDAAQQDCADCPVPEKQPACLGAAAECNQGDPAERQQCLEEARDLCEEPG